MLNKQEIPTPALLVDLDAFESNLSKMADAARLAGKKLRPHAKAHKCVEIAKRQIAAGAAGVCVATVAEAELMAAGGIRELLLTSPLVDPAKMTRIAMTGAMVAVDHVQQAEWYQQAALAADVQIGMLVDLDVGDHRTGAATLDQALDIALKIDQASHLWLRGVQAYSVRGSHGGDSSETFTIAARARDLMASHGLHTDIVSGGSTGTWNIDLNLPGITELQAGSYALMDLAYRDIGVEFRNALTVLATVVSANHAGFVTVDAGFKAFSTDRPFGPEPVGLEGAAYRWGGDEFGYVDGAAKLRLGSRVEFIPPHCDPTVNLYNEIYACRGNIVEEVWPVGEITIFGSR
ncbi:MAG: alanine racemase [Terriglobia bacterium]